MVEVVVVVLMGASFWRFAGPEAGFVTVIGVRMVGERLSSGFVGVAVSRLRLLVSFRVGLGFFSLSRGDIGTGIFSFFVKRFLNALPSPASLLPTASISAVVRADASCAANSWATICRFSFLASFNFMPRLLSLVSPRPRESALISPGANVLPGAVVAILSSSIKFSPLASAFAFAIR